MQKTASRSARSCNFIVYSINIEFKFVSGILGRRRPGPAESLTRTRAKEGEEEAGELFGWVYNAAQRNLNTQLSILAELPTVGSLLWVSLSLINASMLHQFLPWLNGIVSSEYIKCFLRCDTKWAMSPSCSVREIVVDSLSIPTYSNAIEQASIHDTTMLSISTLGSLPEPYQGGGQESR